MEENKKSYFGEIEAAVKTLAVGMKTPPGRSTSHRRAQSSIPRTARPRFTLLPATADAL